MLDVCQLVRRGTVVTAVTTVTACGGDGALSPRSTPLVPGAATFGMFSIGDIQRSAPGHRCTATASPHRQFDFWVGEWRVTGPTGSLAGFNRVRSEVDGCVVAEYWAGAGGLHGWSINAYDPNTQQWHQHWVAEGGMNLQLTGELQGETMVIGGPRLLPNGTTILDRIAYIPLAAGSMRQFWDISLDGGATWPIVAFDGLYQPVPPVTPPPSPGSAGCLTPLYRAADFMIGVWDVEAEHGPSLGTATITSELSQCVLVEQFRTVKGYEWKSFLSYARVLAQWFHTRVDSEGHRVALAGTAQAGGIVLTGTTREPNGRSVAVRVTFAPLSSDAFRQTVELSRDGGSRWATELSLLYRKGVVN